MERVEAASAWRTSLQLRYAQINAAGSAFLLIPAYLGADLRELGLLLGVGTVDIILQLVFAFATRLSPLFLASFALTSNIFFAAWLSTTLGWMPGTILLLTAPPLVSSVTHGRRVGLATALLSGLILLAAGYGMSHGHLPVPTGQASMAEWPLWMRVCGVCTVSWITVAMFAELGAGLIERTLIEQLETRGKLRLERAQRAEVEQSRDQAKAAFVEAQRQETIAALAGGLAHDFNNTLMVIMSWAELLREAQDDEELQAEAHASILSSAEQASSLARQLLGVGRKHLGTPEPVDLAGVLALSVASLRKLVPGDVRVRLDSRPVPLVLAEPSRLQQVILNLAINARDAMPEGGELRFELLERRDESGTDWSGFAVHDSGTGMDAETQAKIFKPFFTTKAEGRGTGLGLASVATIIEELGGELELESTLGVGTTFTVWLPARADLQPKRGQIELAPSGRLGGHVLIVENEAQVCSFIGRTLEGLGLSTSEALDGDAALAHIESCDQLALLCTDGVMPGTKPAYFIERALERFPDCEILVCSGHLPDDLLRRQIAVGRYAFLPKPFAAADLRRHVHALLSASAQHVA